MRERLPPVFDPNRLKRIAAFIHKDAHEQGASDAIEGKRRQILSHAPTDPKDIAWPYGTQAHYNRGYRAGLRLLRNVSVVAFLVMVACVGAPTKQGPSSATQPPNLTTPLPQPGSGMVVPASFGLIDATWCPGLFTSPSPLEPAHYEIVVKSTTSLRYFGMKIDGLCATFTHSTLVQIDGRLELDGPRCRAVCAHELGHALGLSHHDEPGTWMYASSTTAPPGTWPTPDEIADCAKSCANCTFKVTLVDLPPCTARSVRWAVACWNSALRRDAITVN